MSSFSSLRTLYYWVTYINIIFYINNSFIFHSFRYYTKIDRATFVIFCTMSLSLSEEFRRKIDEVGCVLLYGVIKVQHLLILRYFRI